MEDWFKDWFDEDYLALYANRDEAEAELAVETGLRMAPELASGPVLDLACGAGRHLDWLRRSNPEAFGLDLSPSLLRAAPTHLRGHLLRGDMRHLPLRANSLAGICLWFTPFGYFSDSNNRALLHNLAALLRPGGVALMDYLNAAHLRENLVLEDVEEHSGRRVHNRRTIEGKRIVKRMSIEYLDSGATREVVESVRVYEPAELAGLAVEAGLKLRAECGDYSGNGFRPDSPRWLAFFERSKGE
ncbi:MAG: class I SAM-dependent methyltransferase [Holophagaceae bacterium]|nr:class I SAM-dependent methyltransferase [Holophagaceae bacterium]